MIAMGEPLRHSQEATFSSKATPSNAASTPKIPFDDFRPSPGRIEMYYQPGGRGVRVDTHAYAGYTIPPTYDSMIGKLITYGKDRREAMDKMSRALSEYMITGVKTTISFQQAILQDPNFRRGVYSTNFIEQLLGGARRELIEEIFPPGPRAAGPPRNGRPKKRQANPNAGPAPARQRAPRGSALNPPPLPPGPPGSAPPRRGAHSNDPRP